MSAPNTNIERQKRNHWGPLSGMSLGIIVVAVLFVAYLAYNFAAGDGVEGATEVIDGRTGAVETVEPAPAIVEP